MSDPKYLKPTFYLRADVVEALRKQASTTTQKEWAKAHGVSPSYVNDVLQGHRAPGATLLKALGFKFTELYERTTQ